MGEEILVSTGSSRYLLTAYTPKTGKRESDTALSRRRKERGRRTNTSMSTSAATAGRRTHDPIRVGLHVRSGPQEGAACREDFPSVASRQVQRRWWQA